MALGENKEEEKMESIVGKEDHRSVTGLTYRRQMVDMMPMEYKVHDCMANESTKLSMFTSGSRV